MNKFKNLLLGLHGENKKTLRWLYVDKQIYISSISSSEQPVAEESVFSYHDLRFRFTGTGMRHPERLNLFVFIPRSVIGADNIASPIPCEDYLLRLLSPAINGLSEEMENDHKDSREKARFECQSVNPRILRRNGISFDPRQDAFALRLLFFMPLINGTSVNAKSGFRAVRDVLERIENTLQQLDRAALEEHLLTYRRQSELLEWILSHDKIAFVADGSILPRQGDSELPLQGAVPFSSPDSLRETIALSDGFQLSGMAVPQGVTVITGGGYSGKSTLLDALEMGIYHHIPGDGREYVVSLPSASKICAEDGRPVPETDLSLFFRTQPGLSFEHFSTPHASGSVSQAANILENIYAGCKLLLIDEDTSATNFMIRDSLMRKLVQKEPIIPFTDRVRALHSQMGISSILVIGGSGEYLRHADLCILMDEYRPFDVTARAKELTLMSCFAQSDPCAGQTMPGAQAQPAELAVPTEAALPDTLQNPRYWKCPSSDLPFHISRNVSIDHAHYIQINDYTCNATHLTALVSEEQFHTLCFLLECCLSRQPEEASECRGQTTECRDQLFECRGMAAELTGLIFNPDIIEKIQADSYQFTLWLEEIRPMDLLAALFRLRTISPPPCKTQSPSVC